MPGSPRTSWFSANRASAAASSTAIIASSRTACAQNAFSRGVSPSSVPRADLNHTRSRSISAITAIGASHSFAARSVNASKSSSGGVSRSSYS